jgi:hypothetical protein
MRTEGETLTFTHIPDKAKVQVFLKDGTCFTGTSRQSAGWPWVSVQGQQEPFSLADVSPKFAEVKAIEVLSNKPFAEEETRKYGEIAYTQPRTRQEYEDTLWQLATMVRETNKETDIDKPNYSEKCLRAMQLENQFNKVADEIELAKTKRRYILNTALMHKRGEPLVNPLDLMGSPIDARALDVPKETDFDPNRKIRKARSLSPSIAYPTKFEVEASLRDAKFQIAKPGGIRKNKRAKFERIVEKREKQLQRGLYREAIAALEKVSTQTSATSRI